jgi:hypothetical protein
LGRCQNGVATPIKWGEDVVTHSCNHFFITPQTSILSSTSDSPLGVDISTFYELGNGKV